MGAALWALQHRCNPRNDYADLGINNGDQEYREWVWVGVAHVS